MRILAIETSCDETALAVVETEGGLKNPSFSVLGNALYSQAALHAEYGGVFPNLAKREHQQNLMPLLKKALEESDFAIFNDQFSIFKKIPNSKFQILEQTLEREPALLEQLLPFLESTEKPPIDAIAVTHGPGLAPALWVGVNFAKALAAAWDMPVIPINHMEGHVVSALLKNTDEFGCHPGLDPGSRPLIQKKKPGSRLVGRDDKRETGDHLLKTTNYQLKTLSFAALALLVSGGHTELVLMREWGVYELVGATRDDAAGEAFDKAARLMGLPYPGGPEISRLADSVRKLEVSSQKLAVGLPRPMLRSDDFDFSFSGLKTAVRREFEKIPEAERDAALSHLAREFEDAVVEVLVAKTVRAAIECGVQTILVGGGVSANIRLREVLTEAVKDKFGDMPLYFPDQTLTGDNAVMIGVAAGLRLMQNPETPDPATIVADGNLKLAS